MLIKLANMNINVNGNKLGTKSDNEQWLQSLLIWEDRTVMKLKPFQFRIQIFSLVLLLNSNVPQMTYRFLFL